MRTAILEIGFHVTFELKNLGEFNFSKELQVLLAGIVGEFHDLRHLPRGEGILHQDKDIAYPLGQKLANSLLSDSSNGIVYPSVRDLDGTCIVAFDPRVVQRVRNGGQWKLTWKGSPEFVANQVQDD